MSDAPGAPGGASSVREAAPKAVVAGHGALAAGLVSAVEQITGQGKRFVTLSNASLSGEQVEQALRAAIASSGAPIIFTDLPAGSWTLAARRVQRDLTQVVVVTGVNLAMLLDFLFQAGDAASTGAAAVDKGRTAIGATVSSAAPTAPLSDVTTGATTAPARGSSSGD